MKNFTKLRIALTMALMVAGMASVWGQVSNPLTVAGNTLYKQGTNSGNTTGPVGTESPDLVTKGTRVPYLVIPDTDINPTWDESDPTNTTTVTSTWTWSNWAGIGTIFTDATHLATHHYISVDVTGNAGTTATINVQENNTTSGCSDGTGTDIIVKVVAQPAASALAVTDGSAPLTSICVGGSNNSLNVAFPTFNLTQTIDAAITTTGSKGVKVLATLTFTPLNGSASDLFTNKVLNVSNAGVINTADFTVAVPALTDFDSWGKYTLTINKISDKISRKDLNATGGYFDVTSVSADYYVYKTPTTGVIYHLPNN